jgi:hypothetical protein
MQSLKDQNWVLYYALIEKYLKELAPIIYTPTEVRPLKLSLNSYPSFNEEKLPFRISLVLQFHPHLGGRVMEYILTYVPFIMHSSNSTGRGDCPVFAFIQEKRRVILDL